MAERTECTIGWVYRDGGWFSTTAMLTLEEAKQVDAALRAMENAGLIAAAMIEPREPPHPDFPSLMTAIERAAV